MNAALRRLHLSPESLHEYFPPNFPGGSVVKTLPEQVLLF